MKSETLYRILSLMVTILVPVVLVLAVVRLLLTPYFLTFEYNTPGFPDDPYGFTKEERLYWSDIARLYLLNDEGISYLGDLRFPDGELSPPPTCATMDDCTHLYNNRELGHMADVKAVVQIAFNVLWVSLIVQLVLGVWAWRGGWRREYRRGLSRGGWLTVLLLGSIILFVLVAFGVIFVAFHNIFFAPGTWTFLYSDTLIRLFPERFWRDTFIVVGLLAGGVGLAMGWFLREK